MKRRTILVLALLGLLGITGAWADDGRREGGHARNWSDGSGRDDILHESRPFRRDEGRQHDRFRDQDRRDRWGEERERERFGHRHGIVGVPIIIGPGYYNSPPPVYVEQAPQTFEEDGSYYWYYCPNLGYYPNVQDCPSGWLKVIPNNP